MNKIMLVCNAGMSTGMLAKRMEDASNGKVRVFACGEAEYLDNLEGVKLILVGPQIRYLISEFQSKTDIPVLGINPQKYGLMDGKGVLDDIKEYIEEE